MNPVGLHTLHPARGSRHRRTRVGRGSGSGKGTYSGRGIKGQRARTGGRSNAKFLGKRTPVFIYQLAKRRGFRSIHPASAVVTVGMLEKAAPADGVINLSVLRAEKLIPRSARYAKILAQGTLTKRLIIQDIPVSAAARKLIESAGGTIHVAKPASAGAEA